jgi:hypothetical protein
VVVDLASSCHVPTLRLHLGTAVGPTLQQDLIAYIRRCAPNHAGARQSAVVHLLKARALVEAGAARNDIVSSFNAAYREGALVAVVVDGPLWLMPWSRLWPTSLFLVPITATGDVIVAVALPLCTYLLSTMDVTLAPFLLQSYDRPPADVATAKRIALLAGQAVQRSGSFTSGASQCHRRGNPRV